MTIATLTTPMDLAALGALLARYPMEWWVAGMLASALVGALALVGLRTAQHHSPPLRRFLPAQAYGVVLAAMGASAFTLVLAGATMAELAESWSEGGRWGTLDDAIAQGLRTHADTAVLQWFAVLTHLGDSWVLTGCRSEAGARAAVGERWTMPLHKDCARTPTRPCCSGLRC